MKNKLLISFILFILILSFFTCSFAVNDNEISFNAFDKDLNIVLPSGYGTDYTHYLVLSKFIGNQYGDFYIIVFILSNHDIVFDIDSGTVIVNQIYDTENIVYYKDFTFENSIDNYLDFSNYSVSDFSYSTSVSNSTIFVPSGENSFVHCSYSNHDIFNSSGDLVFQAPQVNKVVIPAIQQVEEIPQVMGQIMRILIPIGLIAFSIGLVIYLTRLVISRVQ